MGKFDTLLKTHNPKRKYFFDYTKIYKRGRFSSSVDYTYFENMFSLQLLNDNKKKKFNEDLIALWGQLDMRKYIDYDFGNTTNLYLVDGFKKIPVNQLEEYNYLPEDSRKLSLLDIKYIKHLTLETLEIKNVYLATYEICDENNDYRPYVELFIKDENDNFIQYGYGYDSNNNGNVELYIDSFNYPVFLTPRGFIHFPLTNKNIKISVYDYITDSDIQKIEEKK